MYFFDLDGTLLDSNGIWVDIDREFLGRFGVEAVPGDYTEFVTHCTFHEAAEYTQRYFSLPLTAQEIAGEWERMAREAYGGALPLKSGAKDFLERCRASGISCALLTSCMPPLCRSALEAYGLTELFSRVFTTAELGLEKRERALYDHVAGLCGLEAGECTLFDDSPVCCRAAVEAGWRVFAVPDPIFEGRAEELRALCPPGHYPFDFTMDLPD